MSLWNNTAVLHDKLITLNEVHIQCISHNQVWHYGTTAVHHLQLHLNNHNTAVQHYVFLWKYIA